MDVHMARRKRSEARAAGDPNWRKIKAVAPKKKPEFDGRLAYLMTWYREIRGKQSRGYHHEPVAFTEILAYFTLYRLEWDAFDVETLGLLDDVWRNSLPKPKTGGDS